MTVETTLRIKVVQDADGRSNSREPVTLRFDPAAPLAVSMIFNEAKSPDPMAGEGPPTWLIGRAIFAEGGGERTGDVFGERDRKWLTLTLRSSTGSCKVALAVAELDEFLQQTYRIVPLGEEVTELHLDSAIAELLGSAL